MKKFNIGDKVIALTNPNNERSQPRVKGKIYIIENILYCSQCGDQMVNIGVKSNGSGKFHHAKCNNTQENKGLYWTSSNHFAKIDEFDQEIEIAIAEENYEIAALLRDLKLNYAK